MTDLPSPNAKALLAALERYEPASMHEEVPVAWSSAQGSVVTDADGNTFYDGCSGIFAVNCGHNHPYINAALIDAIQHGNVHSYLYPTGVRANLLARLASVTGYEQAFLCTTGSEAVEAALRVARAYTQKENVFALRGCFHGKTLAARQLREQQGLNYPPYAAVITEPYQGWSARFTFDAMPRINELRAQGVPWISDEVQAGFGRTGKLFGWQHLSETPPDLVVCGKALGNGMPIAAVLGRKELFDAVPDLSSTHSGHPLGCAAALATLDVLRTERLVERAQEMGRMPGPLNDMGRNIFGGRILDKLDRLISPFVSIYGAGMIWALHLRSAAIAHAVVDAAFQRGLLLVRTGTTTVKFGPPLNTPFEHLDDMLDLLCEAVEATQLDV